MLPQIAGRMGVTDPVVTSRRDFLKLSLGAGAGLVIGMQVDPVAASMHVAEGAFNPFVRITPDDTVTVIVKHLDKGQGSATGLATLVADELGASIEQVRTEFAPADAERYKNLALGVQGTGGSTAIANSWIQYRQAGAAAREMLAAAAAAQWHVKVDEVTVVDGFVRHVNSANRAPLGTFAEAAAKLALPAKPHLRSPEEWRYIGKSFPRVDVAEKSSGAVGLYGMDVQLPGMLVAVLAKPPKWGATVRSVDDSKARAVAGVVDVLQVPQGVVVLAKSTWPALKARNLLLVDWDESGAETRSSADLFAEYHRLAETPGLPAHVHGDVEAALAGATQVVEASYEFPYLAHAPMEPLDITVQFDGERAEFWTGSQLQTVDQNVAAAVLGIEPDKVSINTLWAGGSFGRRAIADGHYAAEAASIARVSGRHEPIKLVYSREDDIRGGYYRPMYVHRVRAGLDAAGNIVGWHHRVVGQSIMTGTAFEQYMVKDGVDHTSVEGIADMGYAIGALGLELHTPKVGVPVLWWRSVGHTHTAYVVETMIDELAMRADRDAVEFRLALLGADARKAAVLRLAAEKAGWTTPPADGVHRGVAVHKSFDSYVAEIAEVRLRADGRVKVERVVCAVDCGQPVNPDNIVAQVEGALGYGLGAVLRNEITLADGAVEQGNFDRYLPLRMDDMPTVEVHIVPSSEAPTGIGEPGTPPIGPAVANAIARAKGLRVRELPMSKHGLA